MTRFVPVTVLVMLLTANHVASADGTLGPNGAQLQFLHLKVWDGSKFFEPEATKRPLYFNLAHCTCGQQGKTNPALLNAGTFEYLVQATTQPIINRPVDFFAGPSCATDDTQRNMNCQPLLPSIQDVNTLFPGGEPHRFNLYELVNSKMTDKDCLPVQSAVLWAFVSTAGNGVYDFTTSQNVGMLTGETASMINGIDTQPPPLPTDPSARPNEGGIDVTWKPPSSNSTDVAYYQALCANLGGSAARARSHEPQYVTTQSVCSGSTPSDAERLSKTPLANGENPVDPPTGAFAALDASYICGQADSGTANSLPIRGLENGTPYQVILLAIDLHGNFSATYFDHTITPQPATDFWEDLHDRGSKAEGGLCLLAETYGDDSTLTRTLRAFRDDTLGGSRLGRWLSDAYYATLGKLGVYVHGSSALRVVAAVLLAPPVLFALLWHWLSLPGVLGLVAIAWWYRRRRRTSPRRGLRWSWLRSPAFAGIAAILLGAGQAHAGGGYQPYWEDSDPTEQSKNEQAAPGDPSLVKWHAGIRVGPYIPDIDNQLGEHPGPYEQNFGGYRILPMLDVDRILWTRFGQVGVGATIGYMQKTAHAFAMGSDPTQPDRPRSPGATNAFRLIPFALTATYRFTMLDDNYGVPLVPYVRGGLSYYVWWIDAPNGEFATVCKDGGVEPNCDQNQALGASLGVQGSIGLAIRAERIDASAARSMKQSGIEHAGIYGELSLAKVDGFGSDKKLSVGDRTWFAGVDFEF